MKVLITGACGFVGQHLTDVLIQHKHKVIMGVRKELLPRFSHLEKVFLDITNVQNIKEVLTSVRPDAIIHLAAQSKVTHAWDDPAGTFNVNTLGTINLVKQVCEISPTTKILSIGSSEEYGLSAKYHEFLNEITPCLPQNPYASSKLAAGEVALQLARQYELNLLHVRPFNHFGPGQDLGFVISDFASQIARIEVGYQEPIIHVGDLSSQRDFTDVRDIVVAYQLLIDNKVDNGIFNISSGIPRSISDILDLLLSNSKSEISVEVDQDKFRPAEVAKFVGDSSKLRSTLGWNQDRELEQSLIDTLDWWRKKIGCHG